jgi:phosphoribosylformimino-5-aminoimidazole carboxamide ribotide isomerase
MFEVIPAVDIRGGRCVRLYQGDYARETVFADDPVAMALRWVALGAPRLHVVDLDAARDGGPANRPIIARIIAGARVPVQVGGGVRSSEDVAWWLDEAGADRVVIGTLAFRQPVAVAGLAARYSERIAVALDVRDGAVRVRGWTESSGLPVDRAVHDLAAAGVRRFVYTDIARDGTLSGPDVAGLGRLLESAPRGVRFIASGGVASLEHILALARLDIDGVIVGRALYDGRIELAQAIENVRRLTR